jgi:Dolichol-phosphate mannosyltransferase subunit 3 (DPM3)
MLRYQIFVAYGVAFISAWYNYGLSKKEDYSLSPAVNLLVTFAPIWAVLALGIFLLARLILGVLAYQDCPDAAQEIDRQIVEARVEMKRRKIIE